MSNTAGETVITYPSRAPEFTHSLLVGFVLLIFCVFVLCVVSNVTCVSGLSIFGCLRWFSRMFFKYNLFLFLLRLTMMKK